MSCFVLPQLTKSKGLGQFDLREFLGHGFDIFFGFGLPIWWLAVRLLEHESPIAFPWLGYKKRALESAFASHRLHALLLTEQQFSVIMSINNMRLCRTDTKAIFQSADAKKTPELGEHH